MATVVYQGITGYSYYVFYRTIEVEILWNCKITSVIEGHEPVAEMKTDIICM